MTVSMFLSDRKSDFIEILEHQMCLRSRVASAMKVSLPLFSCLELSVAVPSNNVLPSHALEPGPPCSDAMHNACSRSVAYSLSNKYHRSQGSELCAEPRLLFLCPPVPATITEPSAAPQQSPSIAARSLLAKQRLCQGWAGNQRAVGVYGAWPRLAFPPACPRLLHHSR